MKKMLSMAALLTATLAVPANAAFVLDRNGGNGSVISSPNGFTLVGSNTGSGNFIRTTFTDVASSVRTISFNWRYTTSDEGGGIFDPAGFVVGQTFNPLSQDDVLPGDVLSGFREFTVQAGQRFGFYVTSIDDQEGSASLQITPVPEPATWALLILGFGFVGGALRYQRRHTVVRFA